MRKRKKKMHKLRKVAGWRSLGEYGEGQPVRDFGGSMYMVR